MFPRFRIRSIQSRGAPLISADNQRTPRRSFCRTGLTPSLRRFRGALLSLGLAGLLIQSHPSQIVASEGAQESTSLGAQLPHAALVPFLAMLLSIAVFPLVAGHWWEHNR